MVGPIALHTGGVLPKGMFSSIPKELVKYYLSEYPDGMSTPIKRELEDWEKAECAALKAEINAYNEARPRRERITQEAAGGALGMGQGAFSNYLNGRLALNKDFAVGIFRLFGIPVDRFSPRIAAEIAEMASAASEQHYQKDDKYQSATPEHRQAVDELVDKLLDLSPEQALKVKQAMELLMPANDTRKN